MRGQGPRYRLMALIGAVLAIGGVSMADAQQDAGGPVRLVPTTESPPKSSAPAVETAAEGAPTPAQSSIAVVELGRFDPSSVGVLSAENGGFEVSLWAGSRRALVERLVPRIPAVTPSRVVQSLRRRLLLTAAQVPAGDPIAPSFLGLRAERLAAAGDYPSALALANLAPPQMEDPALDVVRAEGALLNGNHQAACEVVDRALAAGRRSPYWVRRLSFCRVLEGDVERARLTAAILRELPGDADPLFDQLLAILADGADRSLDDVTTLTPLHFAMIRAARRAIPDGAANSEDPAILRALATSANASIEARLRAGEAAEIAGVLSAESLGQIYASLAFSDDQRANVLSAALEMPRSIANALLYQTAVGETIPAVQAEALRTALRLANVRTHGMVARVSADRLAALAPDPDLMWFAADAGLGLLHAGAIDGARAWFDLARQVVSASQPDAALAVLKLWAPLTVSGSSSPLPWAPAALAEWWRGVVDLDRAQAQSVGGIALTIFEDLGLTVPEEVWDEFTGMAAPVLVQRPSAGLLRGLQSAARAGRVGEIVLFALVVLGEQHPSEVDTIVISDVVTALVGVGLLEDARALALEAIVGRSL